MVWYAAQTLYCREERVASFLEEKGLNCFIPMRYQERVDLDGKKERILAPAVHNLIFIQKTFDDRELDERKAGCPYPLFVIRNRDTRKYYEIPEAQMVEFRAVCDPNYEGTLYVDSETAEARPGQQVRVIRGTFAGLTGKLVRYKNRSYVVVTLATLGVMLHIPKWYCERVG